MIKGIPGKIKWFFSALFSAIREFKLPKLQFQKLDFSRLGERVKDFIDWTRDFVTRFLERIPEEKRRPFLIGLGGILLILLIIIIARPGRGGADSASAMARGFTIPQEELFLPSEPDFVPKLLLERTPRRFWTLDDIRAYWKSPEISGLWREEIKSAVDKLMEGIP